MERIPSDLIKCGQQFSAPVFFDDGANMFLAKGAAVKPYHIDVLKRWKIPYVVTDGHEMTEAEILNEPEELEDLEDLEEDVPEDDESGPEETGGLVPGFDADKLLKFPAATQENKLYARYCRIIEKFDRFLRDVAEKKVFPSRIVDDMAADIMKLVAADRPSVIGFLLGGEIEGMELAKSSVNTAILSLVMAEELELPARRITQLITGALLHDVGMIYVPREITSKKNRLTAEEVKTVKSHSLEGFRIVTKDMMYPNETGNIALQHHERWDGTGYPAGRAGADIDIGARIVSVADAFEAMISEKSYRNSMTGYEAMKNLLSDNSRRFDPDVLKAFIRSMGIYPIGSIVLLNNAAVGRVIEGSTDAPLRPKVRILIDASGRAYEGDEGPLTDLLREKSLFIVRALDPKEFTVQGSR